MNKLATWIWGCAAALPLLARAQIDLTALDRDMAGPRAQVLVLGMEHLSHAKGLKPGALDGLLDRLALYRPDIVTIETEPGEECFIAAHQVNKYGNDYCASTDAARVATGLDIPAALAEIDSTLQAWPADPAPAQRRRLAAVFLAASEGASAYVQWLQLPASERHAGDGLDAALVRRLDRIATTNNEVYLIAAPLAARLGLARVHHVDNHTGDHLDVRDMKAFLVPVEGAWKAGSAALDAYQKQWEAIEQGADLLPLYRSMNSPAAQKVLAEVNVRTQMLARSKEGYPQMWVAGWEIRNLRIAANIRETFRERPGARVLALIGASHKPWLDAWLGMLQGVDIVDAGSVLK